MEVTNRHFKKVMNQASNFLLNGTPLPEDLAFIFVEELKVTNLIIPAVINENGINFPQVLADDELLLLPLFTDGDEFLK